MDRAHVRCWPRGSDCLRTSLRQGLRSRSYDAEEEENERPSVFDAPEAEPTCIFVNPFACGISPLDWRDLQVRVLKSGRKNYNSNPSALHCNIFGSWKACSVFEGVFTHATAS